MNTTPEEIRAAIVRRLRDRYGAAVEDVSDDRPLAEQGLTSRDAVALTATLSELTGRRLPATLLWEAPTIAALLHRLDEGDGAPRGRPGSGPAPAASGPPAGAGEVTPAPVAVVGIGCRLPGGTTSPAGFWRLLTEGRDAVGTVPEDRWKPFVRAGTALPEDLTRAGGYLDDIAGFDADFFGIGAEEAVAMDPQQRMLLEVAREALDHAAIPAPSLAGTRTGVFVGISGNEYAHLTTADPESIGPWTAPGVSPSVAAGRLSYALDLRGPSMAVDTACSSSLVAVVHAVRSLVGGESDTALAGGVNLLLSPAVTLGFQRAGALAPDGRCKAFDAAADGIVRAEGCGVVVLKRLADAERDGDRVLAVIHATAVNSDGRSNGLLAPNAEAQRELLEQAHAAPATVDYVEAHGTGTALGDPIEAGALGAVLGSGRGRAPDQPLLLGSVKTNLGHLEAAAGIAGLIKTVLALHHDEIPPQLHFTAAGPHADPDALGLRVVTSPEPWPRYSGSATAGVSAFGFGGTNAHVVLGEYRPRRRTPAARPAAPEAPAGNGVPLPARIAGAGPVAGRPCVVLLDGPAPDRVRDQAAELAGWLGSPGGRTVRLADLARTLAGRTGRGRHRAAVVARDRAAVAAALDRFATGRPDARLVVGGPGPGGPGAVWVFSGYGSQWPGMGHRLLDAEPAFAAAVDRLEPVLRDRAGISLRAQLQPGAPLSSPAVVMPALFGLQVSLAALWRSYGFEPAAVIGHSLGEVAAAVVSGALDADTGAHLVAVRSRLLSRLSGGAMAVVDRPAEYIAEPAGDFRTLRVAVHASPVQSVVTGSAEDVAGLVARVTAEGGFARRMDVEVAGHSAHVDPVLAEFAWEVGAVRHAPPGCRHYSTVREDPRAPAVLDTEHWVANLRAPVRFAQAVRAAAEDGHRVFVEVAPHGTQSRPLTDTLHAAGVTDALVLPTLRRDTDDALTFRTGLATLLVHGVPLPGARTALHPDGRIVDVPSPRWRHRRFWAGEEPVTRVPGTGRAEDAGPGGAGTLARLRGCVAEVMGFGPERLDPDLPLTELGLDSLVAARIRDALRREFGITVAPAALLRQGTLRAVAELLPHPADPPGPGRAGPGGADPAAPTGHPPADAGPGPRLTDGRRGTAGGRRGAGAPGRLRTFPASGTGAPLFLAHAAGGSSEVYARLVEALSDVRPVYGFDRLPEPDDVPGRAAAFARRVREVSPDGPWLVGGWSYGGVVAQETARRLSAHGTVDALVLLDSVLPLPAPDLAPAEEARRRFAGFAAYVERTYGCPLPLPYEELGALDDTGQIDLVVKALEHAVDLPRAVLEHQRTSYLDLRSGERHVPGRHPGRTLLYRASEPAPHTVRDARYERDDTALGWDAHCPDLAVTPLPGHHLSLLDPPVVGVLAGFLGRDLPGGPARRRP
ncbi:alpha/beta fold hydrolase [Streptomyces sp. NPDC018031]|uniref:alpha/beta fold hydrolase n=1 Tax=Streptomyces sp. NPDC018031 TaxID=3365033 RepID=UPI0037B6658A